MSFSTDSFSGFAAWSANEQHTTAAAAGADAWRGWRVGNAGKRNCAPTSMRETSRRDAVRGW
jgi:hypothetical protein